MPNRKRRFRRVESRNNNDNKDKFRFTNNLSLIKQYVKHSICIENFVSNFGPNDIILCNKKIGFALIQYKDFCPINILDDPYCLDFFISMKIKEVKATEGD